MLTQKIIEDNQEFLDKIALQVMTQYVANSKPKGFADSMSIARVSYKQALAMLEVRTSSLTTLAQESSIMRVKKDV